MEISKSAFDLIVSEEVTSKEYYIKNYQRPEWPGGASGITIGIGYDLGYASKDKINADWKDKVSPNMLAVMQKCAGITGTNAKNLLKSVKNSILIPWDAAIDVFAKRDVPQWASLVNKVLPNCDKLNSTCFGVLVSLSYNRGTGGFNSSTDRNKEMVEIKTYMKNQQFDKIPDALRRMARIWPNLPGLQKRRKREADLFEQGLKLGTKLVEAKKVEIVDNPDDLVILSSSVDALARTPVEETKSSNIAAKTTTTTGIALVSSTGIATAHNYGAPTSTLIIVGVCAVIIAATAWIVLSKRKKS